MALTQDQLAAFESWYETETETEKLYWPDGNSMRAAALAAFSEGLRVADSLPALRYEAQYRRRFLGGAKQAERERRETPAASRTAVGPRRPSI